ncbi:hypothetical protein AB4W76_17195 [Klebsiella pasteurii]|uniref:hypothetical protein n=1 Tax=Klebsiella pasteurii TaxID=2587529 RepID=UPI003AB3E965
MTNNQLTDEELQTLIIELQQTAYRLNGTNSAYLMSDAIKPLRELQERRKAAMDSEPVAWLAIYHGEVYDEAIGITRSVVEAQADHFGWESALTEIIPLYRHAQPAPVVPEGLNPETTDLVLRFASALDDKLYKAEQKYGRSTDWMKDDWYDDCLQSLWEHIEKGDPLDVAAYCAFMWYHGWVTTDYDRNVQNACRAAMLQAGNSPVIGIDLATGADKTVEVRYVAPPGYVMVPKEPTKEMIDAGWLHYMATKNPSSKGTYKAMLAAAPQEVK